MPRPVLEEPYSLSFINLYDNELRTIWKWGCDDCAQDYDRAMTKIDEEVAKQGGVYVQWKDPKQFNLHPDEDEEASDKY